MNPADPVKPNPSWNLTFCQGGGGIAQGYTLRCLYGLWFLSLTIGVIMAKRLPLVLNKKMSPVDTQDPLARAGVILPQEGHFKVPQLGSSLQPGVSCIHDIQEEPHLKTNHSSVSALGFLVGHKCPTFLMKTPFQI